MTGPEFQERESRAYRPLDGLGLRFRENATAQSRRHGGLELLHHGLSSRHSAADGEPARRFGYQEPDGEYEKGRDRLDDEHPPPAAQRQDRASKEPGGNEAERPEPFE